MTAIERTFRVVISIVAPLAVWLGIVALGNRVPYPMDPLGAMLNLLMLSGVLVAGFKVLAPAFPRFVFWLAWLYFPLMLTLLMYAAVRLAWRLYPETF